MLSLIHAIMAISTTAILALAAILAAVFAIQHYALHRQHIRIFTRIPPLETLTKYLFVLMWLSFVLLSATLISAFLVPSYQMQLQELLPKIILSIGAWLLFACLLYGRMRSGWQHTTSIKFIIIGIIMLILAYFGSKIWNIYL